MAKRNILYFIKFFTEEAHADQFTAGKLYMNTLSYFKKLESSSSDDGRPDSTEAVAMWWQPNDILMKFSAPGIGETEITSKDLAAPVSMSFDYHNYLHIFCLYAVYVTGFQMVDGKIECTETEADDIRRQILIDDRCLNFGKHAVVIMATPFMSQVQTALKALGRRFAHGLVKYYDDTTFHGEFPKNEIPFRKQMRFSYQREFRIAIYPKLMHNSPITLDIGSIATICAKMPSYQLNKQLEFKTVPA